MRAHAEDDEPLTFDMDGHVPFVEDQGIRLPWLIRDPSTHMIRAALLEARHPGNLTAEVEAAVQEEPGIAAIDHLRAMRGERFRRGHALDHGSGCPIPARALAGSARRAPGTCPDS